MSAPVATNEPSLVAALSEFLDCYACPDCHAPGDPHGLSNDDVQHIGRAFRTAFAASLNNDEELREALIRAFGPLGIAGDYDASGQELAADAALVVIGAHLTGDTP